MDAPHDHMQSSDCSAIDVHDEDSQAQIQRLVKTYDLSISSSCWTAVDGVQSLSVGISDGAESSSSAVCDLNTGRVGGKRRRSPARS